MIYCLVLLQFEAGQAVNCDENIAKIGEVINIVAILCIFWQNGIGRAVSTGGKRRHLVMAWIFRI